MAFILMQAIAAIFRILLHSRARTREWEFWAATAGPTESFDPVRGGGDLDMAAAVSSTERSGHDHQ